MRYIRFRDGMTPKEFVALGDRYRDGDGVPRFPELAFELYTMAAEAGEPGGHLGLGDLHRRGSGVVESRERAMECYLKAAEAGEPKGYVMAGDTVYRDSKDEAERYYRMAEEAGCIDAPFRTGGLLFDRGVEITRAEMIDRYAARGEAGSPGAFVEAARLCHEDGDEERSVELYMKALDTESDFPYSEIARAYYLESPGFIYNPNTVLRYYQAAADAGDTSVYRELADAYRVIYATDRSDSKARKYYLKAAEAGDTYAYVELADLCGGRECLDYARMAIDAGHPSGWAKIGDHHLSGDALGILGLHRLKNYEPYLHGEWNGDEGEAIGYYMKGVEAGDHESCRRLAELYRFGIGVPASDHEAVRWYLKAMEFGARFDDRILDYVFDHDFESEIPREVRIEHLWSGMWNDPYDALELLREYIDDSGIPVASMLLCLEACAGQGEYHAHTEFVEAWVEKRLHGVSRDLALVCLMAAVSAGSLDACRLIADFCRWGCDFGLPEEDAPFWDEMADELEAIHDSPVEGDELKRRIMEWRAKW